MPFTTLPTELMPQREAGRPAKRQRVREEQQEQEQQEQEQQQQEQQPAAPYPDSAPTTVQSDVVQDSRTGRFHLVLRDEEHATVTGGCSDPVLAHFVLEMYATASAVCIVYC